MEVAACDRHGSWPTGEQVGSGTCAASKARGDSSATDVRVRGTKINRDDGRAQPILLSCENDLVRPLSYQSTWPNTAVCEQDFAKELKYFYCSSKSHKMRVQRCPSDDDERQ
jgi:hypothetical protein